MSDPEATEYKHVEIIEYDTDRGVLAMYDEHTRSEYAIRAGVLDKATRIAVIYELEKLGYTVISPEEAP